jgi:hypothetical protein
MTGGAFSALGPDDWSTITGPSRSSPDWRSSPERAPSPSQGLFVLNVYRTLTSGR